MRWPRRQIVPNPAFTTTIRSSRAVKSLSHKSQMPPLVGTAAELAKFRYHLPRKNLNRRTFVLPASRLLRPIFHQVWPSHHICVELLKQSLPWLYASPHLSSGSHARAASSVRHIEALPHRQTSADLPKLNVVAAFPPTLCSAPPRAPIFFRSRRSRPCLCGAKTPLAWERPFLVASCIRCHPRQLFAPTAMTSSSMTAFTAASWNICRHQN